jgi:hypothetical protein
MRAFVCSGSCEPVNIVKRLGTIAECTHVRFEVVLENLMLDSILRRVLVEVFLFVFGHRTSRVPCLFHREGPHACLASGYWSQWRPSRRLPRDFGVRPPHCLKKKATPCDLH